MTTSSLPVPKQSRLDFLAGELARRITDGIYQPGQRLPTETELQEEWQMSRSVVREAMKVLASQGLVRIEQARGTFVNEAGTSTLQSQLELTLRWLSQTPGDWSALIDVRRVLEIAVAERAALSATPHDLAMMQEAIDSLRRHPNQRAGYVDADLAFHSALAVATGNPLWPALINSLNDLLRRYREDSFRGTCSALKAAEQHKKILDAVTARDPAAATAAMQEHLQHSERDLSEVKTSPASQPRPAKPTSKKVWKKRTMLQEA
jgi:DNA-binding FadR family transcriptional regulator